MKLRNFIFFLSLFLLILATPTFAATKRFNLCFNSDGYIAQEKSLVKYGGLEIVARCSYTAIPGLEWMASIRVSSINPDTKTSFGYKQAPFYEQIFYNHSTSCNTTYGEDVILVSEKGHYLSLDGGSLVMCTNVGDCNCSITGVINKSRIKTKKINN